ncbi:MAG: cation:proton antiporter [Desulfobulbaceae bacterium]|nr:cation:proton antiporter [Desulfobulbaceae bacterium]
METTLGIALLLGVGLLFAKIAQLIRLPSVTGYILAGLAMGPSWLGILTFDTVGNQLDHFTQIALMLIAFGIGEHIEIRRLGGVAKDVGYISIVQAIGAFICVFCAVLFTAALTGGYGTQFSDSLVLSLLLGAVAVATAPAAILHVVRELGARGVLTSTLMAVVAVDDGIAIMMFGMAVSVAHQIVGSSGGTYWEAVFICVREIILSLAMGISAGFIIDILLHKLRNRGEMLTGGLAILLLCGEVTRLLHLSSLLAGMAAGFTIINRDERDVRLFRTINSFEPPIYVLFFTLAGVHLDIASLNIAGWIGLVYFGSRIIGKYGGTWLGGVISKAQPLVRNYLGLALIPQAGVAIGLTFIISGDPLLKPWANIITPVVLAGVVLSELIGPLLARHALQHAGETKNTQDSRPECKGLTDKACDLWLRSPEGISLAPWLEDKFHPVANSKGEVVFGAYHYATVRGLARIATILAHHYHATPLAVRVLDPEEKARFSKEELNALFLPEIDEVHSLGYQLRTEVLFDSPAAGLVSAVEYNHAHVVVLGYPVGRNMFSFQRVLERVSANVMCPIIAVHFAGTVAFDRILIPFIHPHELTELFPIIESLITACHPRIYFYQLLHSDGSRQELINAELELKQWREDRFFDIQTDHRVELVESRLESILKESKYHDLTIMAAPKHYGLKRMFFGCLATSVVQNSNRPMIVVHTPEIVQSIPSSNAK